MPTLVAHFKENLGSEFCNNDWIICSLQVYYRQISSTQYLKCQNQPGEYKSMEIQKSWENVEFLPHKNDEMNIGKCKYNIKMNNND